MPSSWIGELRSRDRGPSLPVAFAFWRTFPENNLEVALGNPIPVLWARCATRTSCPAPDCKDLSSVLPEITGSPQLRTWNLGSETWKLWTAPPWWASKNTNSGWCPRPSSGQIPNKDHAGSEPAPRGLRTLMGPDRTWGLGLIWDPDSDVGNLTRQIQDYI